MKNIFYSLQAENMLPLNEVILKDKRIMRIFYNHEKKSVCIQFLQIHESTLPSIKPFDTTILPYTKVNPDEISGSNIMLALRNTIISLGHDIIFPSVVTKCALDTLLKSNCQILLSPLRYRDEIVIRCIVYNFYRFLDFNDDIKDKPLIDYDILEILRKLEYYFIALK